MKRKKEWQVRDRWVGVKHQEVFLQGSRDKRNGLTMMTMMMGDVNGNVEMQMAMVMVKALAVDIAVYVLMFCD